MPFFVPLPIIVKYVEGHVIFMIIRLPKQSSIEKNEKPFHFCFCFGCRVTIRLNDPRLNENSISERNLVDVLPKEDEEGQNACDTYDTQISLFSSSIIHPSLLPNKHQNHPSHSV
jgi:hypothetical protein